MTDLNPTDGHVIEGVALSDHRFLARLKGAQLLKIAEDPRRTEDARQRQGNTQLENDFALRKSVQRLFEGAKRANVEPYAKYIVGVHTGALRGTTPPIVLFSTAELKHTDNRILIPWDAPVVAIDGETQLAARFDAASINPDTKNDFVPVLICHSRDVEWARQVFHDLNLLSVRPNAAVGIGMDQRDLLTHVARTVEQKVPFFTGKVNAARRTLRGKDVEILTITTLRGACVTLAEGIAGVKYGARPVHVEPERIADIEQVAVEWFTALGDALGPVLADRDNTVASSAAVFTAIGALGHPLLGLPDAAARAARITQLVDELRDVNWLKGKHWEGICGKFTPKGSFSIGGPKEVSHAVFTALAAPATPGYAVIREAASKAA